MEMSLATVVSDLASLRMTAESLVSGMRLPDSFPGLKTAPGVFFDGIPVALIEKFAAVEKDLAQLAQSE